MLSRHAGGCVLSIEVGGDRLPDESFFFEIVGEAGRLRLRGSHPHGYQASELRLEADAPFAPLDAPAARSGLRGAVANVAEVYAALACDRALGMAKMDAQPNGRASSQRPLPTLVEAWHLPRMMGLRIVHRVG